MLADPPRTAVHFGAGSIGLGFIGPLLVNAGFHVIFADINPRIISHLNHDHTYKIHYLEPRRPRSFHIDNISGLLTSDNEGITALARDIADGETTLITTSVGIDVLKHVAPIIAKGMQLRMEEGAGTMNVIACENGKGATDVLKQEVFKHLDDAGRSWAEEYVGFANCSVDRIVPPLDDDNGKEKEIDIGVDRFYEWIIDIHPLKSISRTSLSLEPPVPGMTLTRNLPAYQSRKLFILNCGHAITAYLGFILKYPTISASISDHERVLPIVHGAMQESGNALLREFNGVWTEDEMNAYIQQTIERFRNPNVVDDVKRVGRQPLRKLGMEERLLGPFHLARKRGLPTRNLAVGIAAVLMYRNEEDDQATELTNVVQKEGVEGAIEKVTGLKKGAEEGDQVIETFVMLESWRKEVEGGKRN
ncbi:hypothetical protein M422DRAFT_45392 [Sphaerobolus stellatus SS14]|nr:hypothetical protein M422DRAFT_45392 [Sphaerobolus stellatus SS14]